MEQEIKHILIPTDFSQTSNNALNIAIEICKKKEAVLHLLHVVETRYVAAISSEPGVSAAVIATDLQQEARSQLYHIYERILEKHKIQINTMVVIGVPYDEICKASLGVSADLIVMGNDSISGLKDFIQGSIAFDVIKHAPVPVLTIPGHITSFKSEKILFPVRPVKELLEKYNYLKFFISRKSKFHIAALCSLGELEELSEHKNDLYEIILSLKTLGISYTTEMYTSNNVATKVLEIAKTFKADLIAINATLDYKLKNFFVGPYTQQIVNHSPVPILSFPGNLNPTVTVTEEKIEEA